MSKNSKLNRAKEVKDDEFYTLYENFEKNIEIYKPLLKDKIIYCNCDDYTVSNIFKYFKDNFEVLGLKKLVSTCISNNLKVEFNGKDYNITEMESIGSFDSEECINILKEIDIVITNPPFSKFKNFVDILINNEKDFIIYGNIISVIILKIFDLIKKNKIFINEKSKNEKFLNKNKIKNVSIYIYSTFNLIGKKNKIKINNFEENIFKCEKKENYFIKKVKDLNFKYKYICLPVTLFNYDYSDYELINLEYVYYENKKQFVKIKIKEKENI